MKKSLLIASSLLATALLAGGTFAAYAVTDTADPFGINVTPGALDVDTDTNYTTLSWGESTSLRESLSNVQCGQVYKLGIISLKTNNSSYTGVLSFTLTDETESHSSEYHFIDYVKLYLYSGAHKDVDENTLPEGDPLCATDLKQYSLVYDKASGSASGTEYSLYIEYDSSAMIYSSLMQNDIIDLTVDWNPQEGHTIEGSKTLYFATDWSNCYLYTWDGSSVNGVYPGVKLTKIGMNQYNQSIYTGVILDGYKNMIFSDGGNVNKTGDLLISDYVTADNLLFWVDGSGLGSKEFEESDIANYAINAGINPGPILQAWGWTTDQVLADLDDISDAGYKAVQLSPLQPLGDGGTNQQWSLLYQPVGFSIAKGNDNPLGNETSLKALTAAADAKGISIIVDVVCNHLAAGDNFYLYSAVENYEPEIYYHQDTYLHHIGKTNDGSIEAVVKGNLGNLPDLTTENPYIQERVISLLKEYLDAGVKGFRFDAAKHIETPYDGNHASQFWPHVIGEMNKYAVSKSYDFPYCYGEVLGNKPNRDWNGYTNYIDVSDYGVTWGVRDSFDKKNYDGILGYSNYSVGADVNALLMAETHDNYCDNETSGIGDDYMSVIYAYHAARANSSSLFFARPDTTKASNYYDGKPRIVIATPSEYYKSAQVRAANLLHNHFVGGSEYLSCNEGLVINARKLGDKYGVFICDPYFSDNGATTRTIYIPCEGGHIANGTYSNLVTGASCTANNGSVQVTLSGGVAVLELQ